MNFNNVAQQMQQQAMLGMVYGVAAAAPPPPPVASLQQQTAAMNPYLQHQYTTAAFGQIAVNSAPAVPQNQPPPPPGPPPPPDQEQQKIAMLQNQAKMWQEQKRQAEEQEAQRKQQEEQYLKQLAQTNPEVNKCLTEESQFEEQYNTWKKQFNDWKEQNKDHPDREQYVQYEQQWKQYEVQMDTQKNELAKRRLTVLSKHSINLSSAHGMQTASQAPAVAWGSQQQTQPQSVLQQPQQTTDQQWQSHQQYQHQQPEQQYQHQQPEQQYQHQQPEQQYQHQQPEQSHQQPDQYQQHTRPQQPNQYQQRQPQPNQYQQASQPQQQPNRFQQPRNQQPNQQQRHQQPNQYQQQGQYRHPRPSPPSPRQAGPRPRAQVPQTRNQAPQPQGMSSLMSLDVKPIEGGGPANPRSAATANRPPRPAMQQRQQRPTMQNQQHQQRAVGPRGPRGHNPRQSLQPGVSKGGKKGESNPNLESAGPTKWPTFPGNKMPGGAATGVRPQMAAQSRAPIKRAAPSFQEEEEGGSLYDDQKKLIEQLMGAGSMGDSLPVTKVDVRSIPEHKRKKPVVTEMTADVIRKGTLSMVLSSMNDKNKPEANQSSTEGTNLSDKPASTASGPPADPSATDAVTTATSESTPAGADVSVSASVAPNSDSTAGSNAITVISSNSNDSFVTTSVAPQLPAASQQITASTAASSTPASAPSQIAVSNTPRPAAPSPAGYPGQVRPPRPLLRGQRPMAPGQQPAVPGQRPQRPAYPGQRPTHPGQRPPHHVQRPGYPPQRPGQPGQRPAYPGQRPAYPGQRPAYPGQRPVRPGQRPMYPGQRPLRPGQRPQRPLTPGYLAAGPRYPPPRPRAGTPGYPRQRAPAPGAYAGYDEYSEYTEEYPEQYHEEYPEYGAEGYEAEQYGAEDYGAEQHQEQYPDEYNQYHREEIDPSTVAAAAKGLSAREMEMLKKATAELQGINNGNQPAYSAVEGGYGAAPHQAEDPYYEEDGTYRPDPNRRNLLTMDGGYDDGYGRAPPARQPLVSRYPGEEAPRDPYARPAAYGDAPRRYDEDPYERYEAYRPEARLRRDPYEETTRPYTEERPRGRGLLMDDPNYPSRQRADDPYNDAYRRRSGGLLDDPYTRGRDPYDRDPYSSRGREPLLRDGLLGRDPSSIDPLSRGGYAAQPAEVIDYSHRKTSGQLPPGRNSGSDYDSGRLKSRRDSPPPRFRDRSPVRLRRSSPPPTSKPRPPDLYDAYSSISVPEVTDIRDLIFKPKRAARPGHICLIVRGPPGAGKTHCSKLIRDKESSNGGSAPRILNLDDYFMVEVERLVTDDDTGRKIKRKMLEYEYEPEMEDSYRADFFKSFKKTVEKGFFSFIIVDAVNDKVRHFEEFAKFARGKGFQVYIVDVQADAQTCHTRNTHNRTLKDIENIIANWEQTPSYFNKVDMRGLLQDDAIDDVDMEDKKESESGSSESESDNDESLIQVAQRSKWEMDTGEQKLDKLDGLLHKKADTVKNMEDFLTLPDDYESKARREDGKKHVRWADIEEKRLQDRDREIGFVVGQTNWNRMLDDDYAEKQLNKTKYI